MYGTSRIARECVPSTFNWWKSWNTGGGIISATVSSLSGREPKHQVPGRAEGDCSRRCRVRECCLARPSGSGVHGGACARAASGKQGLMLAKKKDPGSTERHERAL